MISSDMVKHELRVASYELQAESLQARVRIQKCVLKSTKSSQRNFKQAFV